MKPRTAAGAVLLLATSAAAEGGGLAGTWSGQWVRSRASLEIEVTFAPAGDGFAGKFAADQLRAVGVPLSDVASEAPRARWALVGDATTARFEGTIASEAAGDTLGGRVTEGETVGAFLLHRARPSPPSKEDALTFRSGDVTLAGSVLRPEGAGAFPGVVFLHGSGAEGRWASRYLAAKCVRAGLAALVYDKRGVGESQGDWRTAGFVELVADARAAVEALRSQPGVDPARVGIHGHSQGGTIASLVAVDPHVAFVIASAASGVSMADCERFSLGHSLGVPTLPKEEQASAERFVEAIVGHAYGDLPRAEVDAAWAAVRGKAWAFEPPPEPDPYWAFSRRVASHDPQESWSRVVCPALLLYGERDQRVPARPSAQRIAQAYLSGHGARLDVIIFPDADHGFRLGSGDADAWPRSAPGYPDRIIEWLLSITRNRGVDPHDGPRTTRSEIPLRQRGQRE